MKEREIGSLGGVGVLILGREVVCEKTHISCEIMTLRFNGLQIRSEDLLFQDPNRQSLTDCFGD